MATLDAAAVAALLVELGRRTALAGDNYFRAKAYLRAADHPHTMTIRLSGFAELPRHYRQRVTANLPECRQLRVERFAAAGDGAVIRPPFPCEYRKAPSQSGRGGYCLRGFLRQTIVGEFAAVQPRKPTNPHQGMLPCRGGRPG